MDLVEAGRPDMQFADLRLGRTQRRRSVHAFLAKTSSTATLNMSCVLWPGKKMVGWGMGVGAGQLW